MFLNHLMNQMTLNDYLTTNDSPLYDNMSAIAVLCPSFIAEPSFQTVLKSCLINLYGNYKLRPKYQHGSSIIDAIMTLYAANGYKYNTLIETTKFKYNPIENYSMIEEGRDKTTVSGLDINDFGQQKINNNSNPYTDTVNYGAINNGNTIKVSPETNENWYNKESNTYSQNSHIDTTTVGERTNNTTAEAYTNTIDSYTTTSYTHYFTRSGNLGVTTSQQMLMSERQVADFSIYQEIAKDIMLQLCLVVQTDMSYIEYIN